MIPVTLNNIWETISNNPGWITVIIVLLMSLIEVSKIKINPWSAIGRLIGKFLGITGLSTKIDALEKKVDENQATTIRVRILRFEDELQDNKYHSKDSWDQCMDDIRRYNDYVKDHPNFKNEITVASTEHIRKEYAERLEKRDWGRR